MSERKREYDEYVEEWKKAVEKGLTATKKPLTPEQYFELNY